MYADQYKETMLESHKLRSGDYQINEWLNKITKAWDDKLLTRTQTDVAVALHVSRMFIDDPKYDTIAKLTRISVTTVRRSMKRLRDVSLV